MTDTEFLQRLLSLRTDEALWRDLFSRYVDLDFQCFELSSQDEGRGYAGLCLVDATLDLEPEKIALLLLFRLIFFQNSTDFYDLLTSEFNFPIWAAEISIYLEPKYSTSYALSGSARDKILSKIDFLEFLGDDWDPGKRRPNKAFSVFTLGQDFPTHQFDRSLLDGPFSLARILKEEWNSEITFFKSPRYWGLFEWGTSA